MRWRLLLALMLLIPAPLLADETCADCHIEIQRHFAATAMAKAARSADFNKEWALAGNNPDCFFCHAPLGGDGVGCADCHGPGPHPYARLKVPDSCARCHDAPGESTVQRHKTSLAAKRGLNCLSCHVKPGGPSHDFVGANDPDFLASSAKLHLALRKDGEQQALVLAVRPRTGHALPGGTTGRSVWLIARGVDGNNQVRWLETWRFGWGQGLNGEWEDATLAPDKGAILEVAKPGREGAVRIEAELVYRFHPGPLDESDPRQVTISKAQMTLRQ